MRLSFLVPATALLALIAADASARPRLLGNRNQGSMLERADANHDGVISRDEYAAARGTLFERLDRNHAGFVTLADFPRLASPRRPAGQRAKAALEAADADRDGRITRQEFDAMTPVVFDRIDANHDGMIDKGEAEAARKRGE